MVYKYSHGRHQNVAFTSKKCQFATFHNEIFLVEPEKVSKVTRLHFIYRSSIEHQILFFNVYCNKIGLEMHAT